MSRENNTPPGTGLEIAVIGMAGKFPGANNVVEFWENLKAGIESISFVSREELNKVGVDSELIDNPNYIKSCGGLIENREFFDAYFFDYSPKEAELMDPQIRMFHECAWEALEDAGCDPGRYEKLIGLYAGGERNLHWEISVLLSKTGKEYGDWVTFQLSNREFLPIRVSHKLNLKGPAVLIQTACSTSLVAIHTACRALLTGDCHMALAGGVSARLFQGSGYLYQEGLILSTDGHCRAFDARAAGTIGGYGIGVVVLKRLQVAISEGDHIYALVKGSAVNNDGIRKVGFTAPSVSGQAEVIRSAQRFARVDPESIGYNETHGTGTVLGDVIEIEALNKAFNTNKKKFCAIGSVKTNIGHLGASAGVTGFIKTILALKNKMLPPSLHFETPNPSIDFENSPFYVNRKLTEWKSNEFPLRAGVSSFGIGGTNAHVILEEAPLLEESPGSRKWQMIVLSAKTEAALNLITENLAEHLEKNPHLNLANVAYTLQVGRAAFPHRRMMVCSRIEEAIGVLSSLDSRKLHSSVNKEDSRFIVFMFPGQGAQYVNMGLSLYRVEAVFREEMDHCFDILKSLLGYDLKEILYPPSGNSVSSVAKNLNQTEITQPLIFIFEYALAKLLMKWGIKPDAMIGHSIGEYVAACLSGVFSLEDALDIVALRGKLMQKMPPGAMVSVPLAEEQLKPFLNKELSLAAVNSSSTCVVSGPYSAIDAFEKEMNEKDYDLKRLHTSHAFHSKMMDPILDAFENKIEKLHLNKPQIPYISNVTGKWITFHQAADPHYWAEHLRETVRFADGIMELGKTSHTVLVEVGPGRDLTTLVRRFSGDKPGPLTINLVRHSTREISDVLFLFNRIGRLWLAGVEIDWRKFHAGEKRKRISLPPYPFEHRRFWFADNPLQMEKNFPDRPYVSSLEETSKEISTADVERAESIQDNRSKKILYERPDLNTPYEAPTNEIQEILVNIWQEFFGIGLIGIEDDFFDLGGDSLKSSIVIAVIKEKMGVSLTIAEFFRNPTIKKLAGLIKDNPGKNIIPREESPDENLSILAVLRRRFGNVEIGKLMEAYIEEPVILLNQLTQKKLFCFPPGVGYSVSYTNLSSVITDYSIYSFSFIEGEDRLKRYVDIITQIQSHGPYLFFGYSAGGRLAFQLAGALENLGFEVSDIILFDSFFSIIPDEEGEIIDSFLKNIESYLEDLGVDFFKEKVLAKTKRYIKYCKNTTSLEKVNSNVHLVLSETIRAPELSRDWDPFTTRPSVIYQGFGTHVEMLSADYIEKNTGIIRKILKTIESRKQ